MSKSIIMTLHLLLSQFLEELKLIRRILENHLVISRSGGEPVKEHVEIEWVVDFLGISRSTFYRHVKGRLLHPVFTAGKRELYARQEVMDLFRRGRGGFTPYRKLD